MTRLDWTYGVARKLGILNAFFMGGTELGTYIAVLGVILYATYLLTVGRLNIDFVSAYMCAFLLLSNRVFCLSASFVLYAVYVSHALGALSHQGTELARAAGASERIFELLDRMSGTSAEPLSEPAGPVLRGDIEFRNVTFEYPARPNEKSAGSVLRRLSFKVHSGQTVGVVGASGAGKSSILQLIPRLYDINDGSILIDGKSLHSYDPRWLRRQMGFVMQEPIVFHDTIAASTQTTPFFSHAHSHAPARHSLRSP